MPLWAISHQSFECGRKTKSGLFHSRGASYSTDFGSWLPWQSCGIFFRLQQAGALSLKSSFLSSWPDSHHGLQALPVFPGSLAISLTGVPPGCSLQVIPFWHLLLIGPCLTVMIETEKSHDLLYVNWRLMHVDAIVLVWVQRSENQVSWWCKSQDEEGDWCPSSKYQRAGGQILPLPFCSIQALSQWGDAHSYWGGIYFLFSPVIHVLCLLELTDTLRKNV